VSSKDKRDKIELIGFLGVGLDGKDGHQRLTRSEHFLLVGGSEETHEQMQDTAVKFSEGLGRLGKKSLKDASPQEALDLLHDALDS